MAEEETARWMAEMVEFLAIKQDVSGPPSSSPTAPAVHPSYLVSRATNEFFTRVERPDGTSAVDVDRSEKAPWSALPLDWQAFFERPWTADERDRILVDLAQGLSRVDFPPTLTAFVERCSFDLSLDRTYSDDPVELRPDTVPRRRERAGPPAHANGIDPDVRYATERRRLWIGMSPKKSHEVERLQQVIQRLAQEHETKPVVVDAGSGRAHLSRTLSLPPMSLSVLAVDSDPEQVVRAEKLDFQYQRTAPKGKQRPPRKGEVVQSWERPAVAPEGEKGAIRHVCAQLDEPHLLEVMQATSQRGLQYDDASRDANGDFVDGKEVLLVGLHACGDLTPNAMRAYCRLVKEDKGKGKQHQAVLVGCCYNLMTPSTFPLSEELRCMSPQPRLGLWHLNFAIQYPPNWYAFPSMVAATRLAMQKLAFRARLEVELLALGHTRVQKDAKVVGRVLLKPHETYETYRERAFVKLALEKDPGLFPFATKDGEAEQEAWDKAAFYLHVYWTIRSLLGPVIESLILLDRRRFLQEQLGEGDHVVRMVNLFDQASGSQRNVAFIIA